MTAEYGPDVGAAIRKVVHPSMYRLARRSIDDAVASQRNEWSNWYSPDSLLAWSATGTPGHRDQSDNHYRFGRSVNRSRKGASEKQKPYVQYGSYETYGNQQQDAYRVRNKPKKGIESTLEQEAKDLRLPEAKSLMEEILEKSPIIQMKTTLKGEGIPMLEYFINKLNGFGKWRSLKGPELPGQRGSITDLRGNLQEATGGVKGYQSQRGGPNDFKPTYASKQ